MEAWAERRECEGGKKKSFFFYLKLQMDSIPSFVLKTNSRNLSNTQPKILCTSMNATKVFLTLPLAFIIKEK